MHTIQFVTLLCIVLAVAQPEFEGCSDRDVSVVLEEFTVRELMLCFSTVFH